jgi:hypothetical protein
VRPHVKIITNAKSGKSACLATQGPKYHQKKKKKDNEDKIMHSRLQTDQDGLETKKD